MSKTIVLLPKNDENAEIVTLLKKAGYTVSPSFDHKGKRAIETNAEPHQVRMLIPNWEKTL